MRVDEGRAVDVVCIDLSKTFDKVHHGRLNQKIKVQGIHGDMEDEIQNWHGHKNWLSCVRKVVKGFSKI